MTEPQRLVDKLWSYCNVLRDDGVSTIEYTEQLTYLLFLKMAHERENRELKPERIVPPDPWFQQARKSISVERGLIAGVATLTVGVGLGLVALESWTMQGFGTLQPSDTMRYVIPSAVLILLAFQMVYAAFFISVLDVRASTS